MRALLAGARDKQPALLNLARQLVLSESPSDQKPTVDACMDLAAAHAKSLGGKIKRHRQKHHGDILEIRFKALRFGPAKASKSILLLGHLDTVWPLGTLKTMPCRIAKDGAGNQRLYGPGALDMKTGVSMAFTAIEMLQEAAQLENEIILLLNSEEEIGSPVSRPITESLAQQCAAVYVLEPAQNLALKTSRKGTGDFRITVHGLAAHAGVDFTRGRSAILELARQIEKISAWTDLSKGITVNCGVVRGGTKTNVVPAEACAEFDLRVAKRADGPRMEKRFAALKPTPGSGCTLSVEGGINRPPMERTRGTVKLFKQAQSLAAQLGQDFLCQLEEASTGGASDGNFTSALGIPTLDGMGAVGEGAHANHESVLIDHLAPRTALLAAMLS
jgi:glutamate carboxypeptidase